MQTIYLDNAASTKTDEEVIKAMKPYFNKKYGNPSSAHHKGQEAKESLEKARKIIADKINAKPKEIIFTGSGTEANNLAIKGLAFTNEDKKHIITTKVEHDCVLKSCQWLKNLGYEITYLNVDKEGLVKLDELERAIRKDTLLVSIIHGNNEIGTIQDIEKIGEICRKKEVYFHTDACQSFTKTDIDVKKQNLDLVTLNAHKIHGPKGVGALYLREGISVTPLMHGGGHEFGLRSGTENLPGIIGFAKAVQLANDSDLEKIKKLRDKLIDRILNNIPNTLLNGSKEKRLCNNANFSFKYIEGEGITTLLDAEGICCSTGSACSTKTLEPSHVLLAIGLKHEDAHGSVRITLSKYNTEEEIDFVIEKLKKIVERLRNMSPLNGGENGI